MNTLASGLELLNQEMVGRQYQDGDKRRCRVVSVVGDPEALSHLVVYRFLQGDESGSGYHRLPVEDFMDAFGSVADDDKS